MLRSITAGVFALAVAGALAAQTAPEPPIWPEQIAGFTRASMEPARPADNELWEEYGLRYAQEARYTSASRSFEAVAYRLNDSTGAFAAFQWQRPAGARPSKAAPLAIETRDGAVIAHGNYVFRFTGWKPEADELAAFLLGLPKVDRAALPTLMQYLPKDGLVPNSERYVLGPVGLRQFAGAIPAKAAAFQFGAEGQVAMYRTKAGPAPLAIFYYPTPQIARQRLAEFEKLPGAVAKFTGVLVAVMVAPQDAETAKKLVSAVNYQANVTWNERVPTKRDNIGDLVINAFILIGIILCLFIAAGLIFGIARLWMPWANPKEPMIVLHIEDRR